MSVVHNLVIESWMRVGYHAPIDLIWLIIFLSNNKAGRELGHRLLPEKSAGKSAYTPSPDSQPKSRGLHFQHFMPWAAFWPESNLIRLRHLLLRLSCLHYHFLSYYLFEKANLDTLKRIAWWCNRNERWWGTSFSIAFRASILEEGKYIRG